SPRLPMDGRAARPARRGRAGSASRRGRSTRRRRGRCWGERGHAPRGSGGRRTRLGAVPVPAGTRPAAAGCSPSRRVPAALRGHNSRFFFPPLGSWAIVDDAMSLDVTTVLSGALLDALGRAGLPTVSPSDVAWEVPRDPTHGDYATNVAMLLAKSHRRQPRQA